MALIKCPECKKKVSDQCDNCPHCGYPIQDYTQQIAVDNSDETSQPESPSKKPLYKKPWVWIVIGVALLAIIVGTIFLLTHNTRPKIDKEGNPVFVELTNEVYTNAKKYKGYHVNIKGQVFQVMGDNGNIKGIQVWLDPETCEQNMIVYYNSDAEVKQGDYITCTGYIDSVNKYQNAYGATMYAPSVISTDLRQATYIEVMAPTTATITPENLKQEKFGYSISVDKVEFSNRETRVYVTATNNGKAKVYLGNAVIVQNEKQYNSKTNYEANYDEIPYEIVDGVTVSGILVFPTITTADFELTFDFYSGTDGELGKFIFKVSKLPPVEDMPTDDIEIQPTTSPQSTPQPTQPAHTQPSQPTPTQPAPTQPAQPACSHSFKDATCTAPKTCTKCGATEGDALGHDFLGDTCAVCNAPNPNVPLEGQGWSHKASFNGKVASVGLEFDKGFGSIFVEFEEQDGSPAGFGGYAESNYIENRDVVTMTVSNYENDTQGTITLKRTGTNELTITEVTGTIIDQDITNLITAGAKFTTFVDEM